MVQEINSKVIIIISVVVVLMTLLGYVCGILSHNVTIYKQAQEECYEWLEEECPCAFQPPFAPATYQGPNLIGNYTTTGGETDVQTE